MRSEPTSGYLRCAGCHARRVPRGGGAREAGGLLREWGIADGPAVLKIVVSAARTDRDVSQLVAALSAGVKAVPRRN
jgi:hypothetical protein